MSRRKRKKRPRVVGGAIVASIVIIAVSLIVRWSGIGERFTRDEAPFQIEVLNGTGEAGLAMKTAKELRTLGIDVLLVGDADGYDFEETLLIDRKGNPRLLRRLSRRIGCRRTLQQIQPNPIVDVTIIIGRDMERLLLGREK